MPKYHKIRWSENDKKELSRLIKNYNAKIDYHAKKNGSKEGLPQKLKVREVKADIVSRNDFNRTLDKITLFLKKGGEQLLENKNGVKITKAEYQYTMKNIDEVNEKNEKERNKMLNNPVYVNGELLMTARRMATINKLQPFIFNFNNIIDFQSYAKYFESKLFDTHWKLEEQAYLDTLIECIKGQYNEKNIEILTELFKAVGSRKLLNLYYEGYEVVKHDFHYRIDISEEEKIKQTIEVLKKYVKH